ncbi:cobalt-precorrin-7 (C(5))-methyltransferase [Streptococcus danieliae]|uniref:Cobalt-precorrin-7 (C(5))-methyltransferase n=1 Tax=Streptococcus danieliae TaxID=747656 RepID=A0A7Z0M4J2_9STRE|nr:cobalt-precorrin-7 (C(5))-methyltransferase [Streptococcus danieliae]MBF0698471.1 cobalt-precorrin-7 (C(5))-methyltransferase [Streptococcus danieliae]NYS95648.1 cobalt-precorrin-7 (C(5))-methyltransferase [Streptococcus danieliae]
MAMIDVIGIGPGNPDLGLLSQDRLFQQADKIIGSKRHLAVVPDIYRHKELIAPKKLADLAVLLSKEMPQQNLVYLVSGDPLIYGLGKWLSEKFPTSVRIWPGISSIQYLASRISLPLNDSYITSSHAKNPDYDRIFALEKVFMVTDQKIGPYQLAQESLMRGCQKYFIIGENLSYPEERIEIYSAEEVEDRTYDMNVVVIINERFSIFTGQGANDKSGC